MPVLKVKLTAYLCIYIGELWYSKLYINVYSSRAAYMHSVPVQALLVLQHFL